MPCCALSNEHFGKKEEKTSFKRIFEESDEEQDNSNDEKKILKIVTIKHSFLNYYYNKKIERIKLFKQK